MTGEDLGLKPSTVEKSKSEYFPLGKTFSKGLSKEDKEEGLLKKLRNIEEKIEQLVNIKNKTKNMKDVTDFVEEPFSLERNGLKIPTPNQMLSRLPIYLAQIKAGNNSGNLKNEIRQLLYSLYRSKSITKQVYNNLIKYI